MLSVILGGIGAGLIHVFSGPDHLAAIAPLALKRQGSQAWLLGLRWGLGHSSGVATVGIASLLVRGVLPIDHISGWGDRVVGCLLIVLGLWMLRKTVGVHTHIHRHDGSEHTHVHSHSHARTRGWLRRARPRDGAESISSSKHFHGHAAFGIGTLHGVAGSSHFMAIIPSLALPSFSLACSYLLAYGGGTVVAMIAFSGFIGSLTRWSAFSGRIYKPLMIASAIAAVVVGCLWLSGLTC